MATAKRGRRDNGEGTIYPGADGYWHGRIVVGVLPDGEPDRRHTRSRDRGKVLVWMKDRKRERDAGRITKPGKVPTVADIMDHCLTVTWPALVSGGRMSPRTYDDYVSKNRNHIASLLGAHRGDRLTSEHIEKWHSVLFERGLSSSTALKCHRILARALKLAVRRGVIAANPCELVQPPAAADVEITPFSEAEAKKILTVVEGRRNAARWKVAMSLGLRQGESLGLRWEYVDLDTGIIRAWYQVGRSAWLHGCDDPNACGAIWHRPPCPKKCDQHRHRNDCPAGCAKRGHRCPTKTCNPKKCVGHAAQCPERHGGGVQFRLRKGRRKLTVPVPEELLPALKAHQEIQALEKMAAGEKWVDHDLVFCRPDGTPIAREEDWSEFKSILAAAGVDDRRLHDLRHACATLLIAAGVPLRVVQEVLGHSRSSVTEKYTHVVLPQVQEATGKLGKVLFS